MKQLPMVTRFGHPSKMDTSCFGTICKVSNGMESFDIYLQISHTEEEPNWTFIGNYSSIVLDEQIYEDVEKILAPKNK